MAKNAMQKTSKLKEVTVRYEDWVNKDTGEIRSFAVVDKPYSSDFNFHKIWLEDLAKVLDILGGTKFKVFSHILKIINPYSNEVGFTTREISEELSVSRPVVMDVVSKLIQADFMRKVRIATYKINPKMLVKGTHDKRVGLMLKYDDLNNGRQLSLVTEVDNWK
jgi:predicted transcriptional regulator